MSIQKLPSVSKSVIKPFRLACLAAATIAVPAILWGVNRDYLDVGSNNHDEGAQSGSVNDNATIGSSNTVTDSQDSLAVGVYNCIEDDAGVGAQNFASGYMNTINADRCAAIGKLNVVEEDYSAAIGEGIVVNHEASVIVGSYNDTFEYDDYTPADVAFAVGTGTSTASKKNGLIVYHDQTVVIPKTQGNISQGIYTK